MTKFLVIRHGQSDANLNGIFAGHTNSPLSSLGLKQAEKNAEYISENYSIDRVYSSDLIRAFETGRAVAEKSGVEQIADKALREVYAGDWEGVEFSVLAERYPEEYGIWVSDIGNAKCTNGEVVSEMLVRVKTVFEKIAAENPDKTVAVATHGTVIRLLQCICEGKPLSEMKNIPWVSNASISVVTYENGSFTDCKFGFDGHLENMVSTLPPNV